MKASSLMIILGPLLLIGIIGLALHDTSIKNIKAGIYSEDADQEFLKGIQAKLIARSINSENYDKLHWCKEDVKNGIIQMCIELKPQKTGDMGEIHQEIVLHVDFSKQRTVWNIIGKIQGIVDDETTRYREEAIKNIKIELQNLKSESKDIESQLDNAINSLEEIKKYLQESADNGWTTKNRLENIKKEMSEIDSEINSLENVLITYSIPESSYSPELNSIKSSIAYTNEVVDQIESSVNTYNANNALTEVNQALNELENNKEKIIEMQNKAEKITNEDVDGIMNPIKLTHQSVLNSAEGNIQTNLEFLDYLFPSFLIFFILFDSIIFSASTRIRERKTNAYIRNIVSKTKAKHFILGDFITSVIIISLQITGIILLASFFLNLSIMSNLNSLVSLTIISVAVFSLIGLAIGSMFKSQESVIISSISISLLFFVFSSLVTPLETLPGSIASIVKHTPLALLESKLRLTSIFNLPLEFSSSEISALIITILACLGIISFYYKKNKTKEI